MTHPLPAPAHFSIRCICFDSTLSAIWRSCFFELMGSSCLMTFPLVLGIKGCPIRGGHPGSGGRGWIESVSVVEDRRLV